MAGGTVARTAHFALHRQSLHVLSPSVAVHPEPSTPLFAVADVWLGALVPKRWARRAVTRNTIKRQIYAVSAALEPALPIAAHVVRLRAGFDRTVFVSATSVALRQAVRAELEQLFEHARRAAPTMPTMIAARVAPATPEQP